MQKRNMTEEEKQKYLKLYADFCDRHKGGEFNPVIDPLEEFNTKMEVIHEVPDSLPPKEVHDFMHRMEELGNAQEIVCNKEGRPIKYIFASRMDETLGWIIKMHDFIVSCRRKEKGEI